MFLLEKPADKYGNRGYTNSQAQVIEVENSSDGDTPGLHRVIAPATFVERWDTITTHTWSFVEVEGPARFLSEEEYWTLLLSVDGSYLNSDAYLKYKQYKEWEE